MKKLNYITGDATNIDNTNDRIKIILNGCNDQGDWGKGIVKAISAKWDKPEKFYKSKIQHKIGEVTYVPVEDKIYVANMITQTLGGELPFSYPGFRKCLENVAINAMSGNAEIHMPMVGAGLGGASWAEVEKIIIETLCENDIDVTVYKFEDKNSNFYIETKE